jgi:hypothetical protein
MELLQWFVMGILFTLGVQAVAYLSIKVTMPWYALAIMVTGLIAILFGIGWAGASFLEEVPQSGALGLLFFSFPGVIMMVLAYRKWVPKGTQW